jgi:hypothetical protein
MSEMSIYEVGVAGGTLVDVANNKGKFRDVVYASVTAPVVARIEVYIGTVLVDVVYVGGGASHSWWTMGGGKLIPPDRFPNGVPHGSNLKITSTGAAVCRIDWQGDTEDEQ